MSFWKLVRKVIKNISCEIFFCATGKKLEIFEDEVLHRMRKYCITSTLMIICRMNDILGGKYHTIELQLAQFETVTIHTS